MMAGAQLVLTAALAAKVDRAAKLPQAENKVALQVVPVQLRAWVVDQNDAVCRPYYMACLELYPRGKVLNARIHSPASVRPDAAALANFLLDHVLEPPAGAERQRPTHVSFIEDEVVEACAPIMSKLRIECGMLTLADGVTDYVRMFSDKLVKLERASRGDASEQPGILSVPGVTVKGATALMAGAVAMHRAAPWDAVKESIALEALVPVPPGARPTGGAKSRKLRVYVSVLGSGGSVVGFAVMAGLDALRSKYRRSEQGALAGLRLDDDGEDDTAEGKTSLESPTATLGELLCARCGFRVGEGVDADGCRYVHRCGGCKRLLYCDEQCQRLDWGLRHRDECSAAAADRDYVFVREEWGWLRRELALLFVDPTSVPFDDLDAAAEHSWPHVVDAAPPLHPMAYVTVEGDGDASTRRVVRPTADEVHTLTLLATALTECSAPPPAGGEVLLPNGVVLRVAADLASRPAGPAATAGG
jgi:hypothetical protein